MVNFLGTNFGHDSAAALVNSSGQLVAALEEGKLIGKKTCSSFPDLSLSALTASIGDEPVIWGEGWDWHTRLWLKGLGVAAQYGSREPRLWGVRASREILRYGDGIAARRRWRRRLGTPHFTGHHRSHALSLLPWGLPPQSLVVVSDTTGERESMSTWYWNGRSLVQLTRSNWPHSPGATLHQAANHLGFAGERGPGKLMALSAWGTPDAAQIPSGVFGVGAGRFAIDLHRFPAYRYSDAWTLAAKVWRHEGYPVIAELVQTSFLAEDEGADFAAVVQTWFENTLYKIVISALKVAANNSLPVTAVGLAGGAALNCQANGRLLRMLPDLDVDGFVVSPWSGDAGTAIGAAVNAALNADVVEFSCRSPLLGLNDSTIGVSTTEISRATAALSAGRVIGLVSGGVEFGPRALGGRCLLADARTQDSRLILNTMKGRPQFMPLAPVVLENDAAELFQGTVSTTMSWTVPYLAEAARKFPGMMHPSSETRAQLVTAVAAPLLHALLSQARVEGMSLLLLTSLNGAGEPMLADTTASVQAARELGATGCLTDAGWINFSIG